jgi:adenylosuccinate synthase
MKVDVLLGLQWGDEGKGKIVDVLAPDYDVITRFQGGPNAGHTLEFNNIKHILHNIPSGIFRENQINIIANGVVIDPVVFSNEIAKISALNVDLTKRLLISKKAHLILPSHRILDQASEYAKGKTKIGSTLKGIGPTYMDKTGRNGLRIGDILSKDFKTKYNYLKEKHKELLKLYDFDYNIEVLENEWFDGIEIIKNYQLVDSEILINDLLKENKRILAEGAQGTLLDIDFGSYPYVTSSNTICAGACSGMGIAPKNIGEVYGIFKAYCTRVGSGPFPTELSDQTGERLRENGKEYGSTTGRPRRCGWLDLPVLKYAIMLNGVTQLFMTKADVLSGFEKIKVCTSYRIGNREIEHIPHDLNDISQPLYTELKGWPEELTSITSIHDIPSELEDYVQFVEKETGVPVTFVSVGPNREQILTRKS